MVRCRGVSCVAALTSTDVYSFPWLRIDGILSKRNQVLRTSSMLGDGTSSKLPCEYPLWIYQRYGRTMYATLESHHCDSHPHDSTHNYRTTPIALNATTPWGCGNSQHRHRYHSMRQQVVHNTCIIFLALGLFHFPRPFTSPQSPYQKMWRHIRIHTCILYDLDAILPPPAHEPRCYLMTIL